MIKIQDLVPDIYYNHSRDFQFIGRLYDVVLNSIKTNSDLVYNVPLSDNSDSRLVDLMALTLGFKSKHRYNIKQLTAMCSIFMSILRQKGTLNAIDTACKALLTAEGITEDAFIEKETGENGETIVTIFVPQELTDLNLLKDLLTYILPAGCSCNIIRELRGKFETKTDFAFSQNVLVYRRKNDTTSNWTTEESGEYTNQIKDTYISIVPQPYNNDDADPALKNPGAITNQRPKATPGIFINSTIIQPVDTTDNSQNNDTNQEEND